MISTILSFFGITLLYTGLLASNRHMTTAILVICAGLLLLTKPAMAALKLFRANYPGVFGAHSPGRRKNPSKTVYLKIVKSEDEKPTIH